MAIAVLDCTLRDGGYYTDWDFEDGLVEAYLDAMATAPIDTIELGYRSPPKDGYLGQYFYLPRRVLEDCRKRLRADQKIAIMLNEKDVSPDLASGLLSDLVGVVDIIRFAVAPTALESAKALASACHALGFSVAINVMYLNRYINDVSFLATLKDADVDYVSLVDSYGSCKPAEVATAIAATVALLPQQIGFHGHDNIALSFGNALAAIEAGATMVDATVQGMGRGAGNLNTEVIVTYLAMQDDLPIDFAKLSKASSLFATMKTEYGWGSNLAYLISGFAGLPQADVMDWFGTKRYQLDSIVQALRQQDGHVDERTLPLLPAAAEAQPLKQRPVVIVGGGASVISHGDILADFIARHDAVVIHSSTRHADRLDALDVPQVYCLAGQEYQRMDERARATLAKPGRLVVTSPPPRFPGGLPPEGAVFQVQTHQATVASRLGPIADEAPLDLAFAAAADLDAREVFLVGFDGYTTASLADRQNAADVQKAIDRADQVLPGRALSSLTPTHYDIRRSSIYALQLVPVAAR